MLPASINNLNDQSHIVECEISKETILHHIKSPPTVNYTNDEFSELVEVEK